MKGASRFDYRHSISKEEIEYLGDRKIIRGRRVSLTFRNVIKEECQTEKIEQVMDNDEYESAI
jgi:hypothetical protein